MNAFERSAVRRREQQDKRDNPEGAPPEKESLFDGFVSERTVDPIPVGDQTIRTKGCICHAAAIDRGAGTHT
ncbi:hypothetical protein GZH47_14060 [Paenibacillus rhizovicinus]|uniref:Uncharacterized protein n=1 Tax=Paenibacillus rhizovicinus TaxID=2704463 RepID=A0A6C0NT57_9BACL|nr:hypothetical protein [Paenibacillus rhizovicinus]QHW29364.1 hypothetical protein GZH47_14060 [Paenibacillus rhizovicinus]